MGKIILLSLFLLTLVRVSLYPTDTMLFTLLLRISCTYSHSDYSNTLGIQNGPSINIPIASSQANATVVNHVKCTPKHFANDTQSTQEDQKGSQKIKITTNTLHDRFHRSDIVLATVQAHNLWRDVDVLKVLIKCACYAK